MEVNIYTKIFLIALILRSLIKSYLDQRNIKHIEANKEVIPPLFEKHITIEDHKKAASYTVHKIKAAQFFNFIDLVMLFIFTLFGGLELLSNFALEFKTPPVFTGLIFFGTFGLISAFVSLPRDIYFTFVIEEKYGFNKTNFETFVVDLFKGAIVSIILGSIILGTILFAMEKTGNLWWLYAFVFLTLFQIIIIFIYPSFIAPLFNKFSPLEDGDVKDTINNLLTRCGFKSSGLFVMDASKRSGHGNAYFTGFGKSKRIVFFDTLLATLSTPEIEAVLAHELGHMKKKHIIKKMLTSMLISFLAFALLGFLKTDTAFFNGHGVFTISNYMVLALFSLVAGVYSFFLTPFSSYFSRKDEFEADLFAAEESDANMLISALVKMYKDNATSLTPDPAYSKFYYSHPPALERVEFLMGLRK